MMLSWAKRRALVVFTALILLQIAAVLLHLMLGERDIPPAEVLRSLLGSGNGDYQFTIHQLRLPRVLTGMLVGCGLALAGTMLQAITKNPLASPGVIGLNSGAAAAVVAVLVLIPAFPMRLMPWVAFGGAFAAAAVIYGLSWKRGDSSSPVRMLLIGVGISAMAGALITYLLTVSSIFRVSQASVWMAGSLYGRTWEHFWPLLPWQLVLLAAALALSRRLDLLLLDTQTSAGLGLKVEALRLVFILLSVGLAGSAVAMAGTVGFVGLMAPHMARHLVGTRSLVRLPVAALLGGLIVMLADLLGRLAFAPHEIPAGLITALIGVPYMLYLLLRHRTI